jgi:hypothetical protein
MDINGLRYDALSAQRFDIGTTAIYVGYAAIGAADADRAWTIKKVTLSSGNPTGVTWTAETAAVWNDRTTETYT